MVPPHRRASGGLEPAGRALEPAGRASEPAGRTLKPAGRALEPAGRLSEQARRALEPARRALKPAKRASEPAGRALEPAGWPGASWKGQLRGQRGGVKKRENRALPVSGGIIGHHPLRGRCPKSKKKASKHVFKVAALFQFPPSLHPLPTSQRGHPSHITILSPHRCRASFRFFRAALVHTSEKVEASKC